jgi:hypothetical protein
VLEVPLALLTPFVAPMGSCVGAMIAAVLCEGNVLIAEVMA